MDTATAEKLKAFVRGEVTWAEVEGMTFEEAKAIAQVGCDLAAAQDKHASIKNGKGDEKALADTQRDMDRLNMRLQKLVEKRKMMFEMMSTLSMKFNEMAKTALSNMRSA